MSANEKQFGVRLKEPALSIIENRAEQINNSTPEIKITAGGVARYAVEEYAKKLDRDVIETHLQFPYVGMHTFHDVTQDDIMKNHPYVTEVDFQLDYEYEELEKLANAFETIVAILKNKELIPNEKVRKWSNVASNLRWNYNNLSSGLDHLEHQQQLDQERLERLE